MLFLISVTTRQPTRLTTTNAVEIITRKYDVNTCLEQLATDQADPWQVVPRQIFTPFDCLLISVAFVVLCCVGCLWVTGVFLVSEQNEIQQDVAFIYCSQKDGWMTRFYVIHNSISAVSGRCLDDHEKG